MGGAGLVVGGVLAWLHWRLGGRSGRPTVMRALAGAVSGAAAGIWAAVAGSDAAWVILTAALGWQLLLVAATDAEVFWLPDILTLPLLVSGIAGAALLQGGVPTAALLGAAAGFAVLWLLAFAYRRARGREGLGGGDPFLLAAGGAWVGWIGLPSVLLWSAVSGLSVVLAMKATGRAVAADTRLPFGVFLSVGIWMTWIFGPLGGLGL